MTIRKLKENNMDNQTLCLANDSFGGLTEIDHPKRVTIRRGRHDIKLGLLTFVSTYPAGQREIDWFIKASVTGFIHEVNGARHIAETIPVTEVRYKLFNNISDRDAQDCDYENVEHMFECMQHLHPDLAWTDEMTFIFFELQARRNKRD
jgi:hypothetical protein